MKTPKAKTNNYYFILALFSFFSIIEDNYATSFSVGAEINISRERKSIPMGDSLLQVWTYDFQDPRLQHMRPHIFLSDDGLYYLFSRVGFFVFDRNAIYDLDLKSIFPASNINYSLLDNNEWLWLMDNHFNPSRPIFNIQFFNIRTHQQKPQSEFFRDSELEGLNILSVFQLNSGEIVFQASNHDIYLFDGTKYISISKNENLILLGLTPDAEMILMNKKSDQIKVKSISDDSILFLPKKYFDKPLIECYVENDHLICLAGKLLGQGLYTIPINDPEGIWISHTLPENIGFLYNQHGPHYIYYNNFSQFYSIGKYGLKPNDFLVEISKKFGWLDVPFIYTSGDNTLFWTKKGLSIIRKTENKVCNALTEYYPGNVSTRGLRFIGEDKLSVSSYSGYFEIDFNLKDCFIHENKISYSCPPSFVHQTLKTNNSNEIIKFSDQISIIDLSSGNCREIDTRLMGIDHIWDMLHIIDEKYLLGTPNGLYTVDISKKEVHKLKPNTQNIPDTNLLDIEKLEFFRLRYSHDSTSIFAASSMGLLIFQQPNDNYQNWIISEWIQPQLVIRDVLELQETNQLLIASQNNGMLWIDGNNDRTVLGSYNSSNALQNNFSHNILRDNSGRIWLSTNYGLYLINLEKNIWRFMGQFTGFPENEFNYLAAAQSIEGLMAFGGVNGVAIFDPNRFNIKCSENDLFVSSIFDAKDIYGSVNNKSKSEDHLIYTVRRKTQTLKFHFAGAELDRFYSFFIRPSGTRDWQRLTNQKTLAVNELSPGKNQYDLLGVLANGKVVVSNQELIIEIKSGQRSFIGWLSVILLFLIVGFYFRKKRSTISSKSDSNQVPIPDTNKKDNQGFQPLKSPEITFFEDYKDVNEVRLLNQYVSSFQEKEKLPKEIFEEDLDFIVLLKKNTIDSLTDEDFSAKKLATMQTISYRQLHRQVKEKTGLSPNKFISLVKVIEGRRLLTIDKNINIKEVTFKLGYTKASHFSKLFKDVYGLSPKKYQMKISEMIDTIEAKIS